MDILTYAVILGGLAGALCLTLRALPLPRKVLASKLFSSPPLIGSITSAIVLLVVVMMPQARSDLTARFVSLATEKEPPPSGNTSAVVLEDPVTEYGELEDIQSVLVKSAAPGPATATAMRSPAAYSAAGRGVLPTRRPTASQIFLLWLLGSLTAALILSGTKNALPPPAS